MMVLVRKGGKGTEPIAGLIRTSCSYFPSHIAFSSRFPPIYDESSHGYRCDQQYAQWNPEPNANFARL